MTFNTILSFPRFVELVVETRLCDKTQRAHDSNLYMTFSLYLAF